MCVCISYYLYLPFCYRIALAFLSPLFPFLACWCRFCSIFHYIFILFFIFFSLSPVRFSVVRLIIAVNFLSLVYILRKGGTCFLSSFFSFFCLFVSFGACVCVCLVRSVCVCVCVCVCIFSFSLTQYFAIPETAAAGKGEGGVGFGVEAEEWRSG